MMPNTKKILATTVAITSLAVAGLTTVATAKGNRLVDADSMIGVPARLTGVAGQIRGINGGGLPWNIGEASAEVSASGKVEVEFEGLVFAAGPNVGKNTVANMKVIVSCLNSAGAAVNVSTALFPVTTGPAITGGGAGEIETMLSLPSPCLSPMVFITSPGGNWFAVDHL